MKSDRSDRARRAKKRDDKKLKRARSRIETALKKVLLKFNTALITPEVGEWILKNQIQRIAEREGRVFECYARHCPLKSGTDELNMDPLRDFIAELKKIQNEMIADDTIEPRRIQLALNLNKTHWTAIDFEVTKNGIKCFGMDAVHYPTLEPELAALSGELSNQDIYIAHGPEEERPQRYFTCFVFAMDLLRRAFNERELYDHLEEAVEDNADYIEDYDAVAPGINAVRWTSMTPVFVQMAELIGYDEVLQLYIKRNPEQADSLKDSTDATLYEQAVNPGSMIVPHPNPAKNTHVSMYARRVLEDLVEMSSEVKLINSLSDINPDARSPMLNVAFQKQKTKTEALHNRLVDQAEHDIQHGSDEARLKAEEFKDQVRRAAHRPHGQDQWGHKGVQQGPYRMVGEYQAELAKLLPPTSPGAISATVFGLMLEAAVDKCVNSTVPEVQQIIDQQTRDDMLKSIAETRKDHGVDLSADNGVNVKIKQMVDHAFDHLTRPENAGGSAPFAAELTNIFLSYLNRCYAVNCKLEEPKVAMRQMAAARGLSLPARRQVPFDVRKLNKVFASMKQLCANAQPATAFTDALLQVATKATDMNGVQDPFQHYLDSLQAAIDCVNDGQYAQSQLQGDLRLVVHNASTIRDGADEFTVQLGLEHRVVTGLGDAVERELVAQVAAQKLALAKQAPPQSQRAPISGGAVAPNKVAAQAAGRAKVSGGGMFAAGGSSSGQGPGSGQKPKKGGGQVKIKK